MKKYIALIIMALVASLVANASPVLRSMEMYVASQDTIIHDTLETHDTIHVSFVAPDAEHVVDTQYVEYTFSDIMAVTSYSRRGKVAGNGHFPDGSIIELGAVPNKGYRFVRWQDNNLDNPRQVTVNGNTIYTAYFDSVVSDPQSKSVHTLAESDTTRDTIWITVNDTIIDTLHVIRDTFWYDTNMFWDVIILSGNESKGLVSGSGQFITGTEVEIAAIPAEGYRFVFWHDGVKDNPRKVKVDDIVIFVAEFAVDTASTVEPDEPEPARLFDPKVEMDCDGLALTVSCPAHAVVRVFTPNGRLLFQEEGTGDKRDTKLHTFQVPQAGVYLVQVANFPVRKVAMQEGYHHKL